MICPNCKTNIPDDSKFCPDCGTPVVNIDELRAKAKEITIQYKKGYDFYVDNGVLPMFAYNLTATNCEKIIDAQNHIMAKHQELEIAEKKQEEERKIRNSAFEITIKYAKAYNYYVNIGAVPRFVHNLDIAQCQQIIARKNDIIGKHIDIQNMEKIAEVKRSKEQSNQHVLSELNRLGITDPDKRKMFFEHPNRLLSEYWLNWAKEKTNFTEKDGNGFDWGYFLLSLMFSLGVTGLFLWWLMSII